MANKRNMIFFSTPAVVAAAASTIANAAAVIQFSIKFQSAKCTNLIVMYTTIIPIQQQNDQGFSAFFYIFEFW